MASLNFLKQVLGQKAAKLPSSSPRQPLSDAQYSAAFEFFVQGLGWKTYEDFIIPQLSELLDGILNSRHHISVLEIGPGSKSVLGGLPVHQRRKIKRYAAFEPNDLFASKLRAWCNDDQQMESPLPCLETTPVIHQIPFTTDTSLGNMLGAVKSDDEKFDVVLFCHNQKAALWLYSTVTGIWGFKVWSPFEPRLSLMELFTYRTKTKALDNFASFVAGFALDDSNSGKAIRAEWRKVCRSLGSGSEAYPNRLRFGSPGVMLAFNQYASKLPELWTLVPHRKNEVQVKSTEARIHRPASRVRPTRVRHVQSCVRWALKHGLSLTIIGGGHSGHCIWPNVVSIDMGAFNQLHVLTNVRDHGGSGVDTSTDTGSLVIVETGCKADNIIRKTMAKGLTVPLGARPSLGAGLWLQGGIGHLARLYGLACDAIVGAVLVGADTGEIYHVGHVPLQYRPAGSICPEQEDDLLWALKGAGTNFGIVISVTFKAYEARTYAVRKWINPFDNGLEAQNMLDEIGKLTVDDLPRSAAIDLYLYWDTSRLSLGVTLYEASAGRLNSKSPTSTAKRLRAIMGSEGNFSYVDGVGVFNTEMYMSDMHGGHGSGKTSSFKRCVFLNIRSPRVIQTLVAAIKTRPSPLCYLHLVQGGGTIKDTEAGDTAFGCRDWDYACVVTGVWARNLDGTDAERAAMEWVYNVIRDMKPCSSGIYGADLGPGTNDRSLAAKAFGPNRSRLAQLKRRFDPRNVLAYACPLSIPQKGRRIIILVTGESGAGKDHCARVWATALNQRQVTAQVVRISDETKRHYAAVTGAKLDGLLHDRAYKEQHRPALTAFFENSRSP